MTLFSWPSWTARAASVLGALVLACDADAQVDANEGRGFRSLAPLLASRAELLPAIYQPDEPAPGEADPAEIPSLREPRAFGEKGSQWITYGTTIANDFDTSFDASVYAAYSTFLSDDVEWSLEVALWGFFQDGADAYGLNPSMAFRWHFWHGERWTIYTDIGIGLLATTDDVPSNGTSLNFTPKAGMGVTYRPWLGEETRVQVGLRWHHVSNARVTGAEDNPARDAPALYVGLIRRW